MNGNSIILPFINYIQLCWCHNIEEEVALVDIILLLPKIVPAVLFLWPCLVNNNTAQFKILVIYFRTETQQ